MGNVVNGKFDRRGGAAGEGIPVAISIPGRSLDENSEVSGRGMFSGLFKSKVGTDYAKEAVKTFTSESAKPLIGRGEERLEGEFTC